MKLPGFGIGILSILAGVLHAHAGDSFFYENFDNPPYADQQPIPEEWEKGITERIQVSSVPDRSSALTVSEQFLSSPHSLQLQVTEDSRLPRAGVTIFGTLSDQKSKSRTTSDPITLRLAFRLEDGETNQEGKFKVTIMGFSKDEKKMIHAAGVQIESKKANRCPEANFGGDWSEIPESIESGKWYWMEIAMPGEPRNPEGEYTVRIFDTDGKTLLGKNSGPLAEPIPDDAYGYFSISNSRAGSTVYIDDIQVESTE